MSKAVVLARPIKPEWLDMTAELLAWTRDRDEIRGNINEYISHFIKSSINVRKTREILINTWVEVDSGNREFRERALQVYKECPQTDRTAVHWAMMLMAFPVFRDLCIIVGKLSDMQDEVTLSQVQRRIYELWGERNTLVHAIPKIIKTLREFGALEQVKPGVYRVVRRTVKDKDVGCVLLYATLKTSGKLYQSVSGIDRLKELFPFELNLGMDDLYQSDLFNIDRIGGEPVVSI
jgi:hypothetical protein